MPDKTYLVSHKIKVTSPVGGLLEQPEQSYGANHIVLFEDDLPASPSGFDLAPFLATLTEPRHIGITFDDTSGFGLALDGDVLNVSPNTFKQFWAEFGSPGVPPVLKITTSSPGKIKIIALGDPLP